MKTELIESKLRILNADTFHRLADHYLFCYDSNDYESINPMGQSEGKQKSRKGTPDTKIRLASGQYIFIQYTTQQDYPNNTILYKKLLEDLESCLNVSKSKVPLKDIARIVLCFNSNINSETETKLYDKIKGYEIELKLINLSTIAYSIYKYYPYLAKDYLNIEIDTNQLLPLQNFIKEYEKGGFAAPLSNSFFYREAELEEAVASVEKNLITIISGKAGVGKSRLAVEVVTQQSQKDAGVAYCIKNKDQPIINDLRRSLSSAKKYLIYIDDANKSIDHLKALIAFYHETDTKFQMIITVRDYALNEIKPLIESYSHHIIHLDALDSQEIVEIISAAPFGVTGLDSKNKINDIAKGNPRLAIITAVALRDKKFDRIASPFNIYESYFKCVSKENHKLTNPDYIRVLGILAFFRSIDRDKQDLCKKIYTAFNIEENDFWTKLYDLEKYEIVDVFIDKSVVKFSDQILEGFIFYQCFFIDKLIDYSIILDNFLVTHERKIYSTFIDICNTFEFENVKNLILPFIQKKYQLLDHNGCDIISFLKIFWPCLQEETLLLIEKRIDQYKSQTDLVLIDEFITVQSDTKSFALQDGVILNKGINDDIFDLISEFLKYQVKDFDLAAELMFDYVERRQELAEKLVTFIQDNFEFNCHDIIYIHWCRRESIFTKLIIAKAVQGKSVFRYVILKLIPNFFKGRGYGRCHPQDFKSSFSYILPLPEEQFLEMRKMYWEYLIETYFLYPKLSLSFFSIKTHHSNCYEGVPATDWSFIDGLIANNFDLSKFEDVYFVNQILERIKFGGINETLYANLKERALTPDYKKYLALDHFRPKREEIPGKNDDYKICVNKKVLLSVFSLTDFNSYTTALDFIGKCANMRIWESYRASNAAQIIINDLMQNTDYFSEIFKYILKKDYFREIFDFTWFYNIHYKQVDYIDTMEHILHTEDYPSKANVLCNFYGYLPEPNVNVARAHAYLDVMEQITGSYCLYFNNVVYYVKINASFLTDAVNNFLQRAKEGKCTFSVGYDFIQRGFAYMGGIESAERLYLHLLKNCIDFDRDGSELRFILNKDITFIDKCIEVIIDKKTRNKVKGHLEISSVWDTDNYAIGVEKALDRLMASYSGNYFEVEDILRNLFQTPRNTQDGFLKKREIAISNYISKYSHEKERMNMLFEVIVSEDIELENNLKLFLTLNTGIEIFKTISWVKHEMFYSGNEIIPADVYAGKWYEIGSFIEKLTPKSKYLKHRAHINSEINDCRSSVIRDQKWNFITS